ncbi:RHS repeat-associated core domain-containing protein, partial [Arachidicoccus sp.]|uniref:RHS repeat-associated core domain-containing protein n=1 Tax=Arachidicoccus sp. TaxID=1872624 RepID=UPI003D241C38
NVRAVVAKSGRSLEVRGYSDYYPYGMVLRSGGTDYRYGYQGAYAEKDGETDWNAFELRMYDSRIARWLTTDPAGQYYSPYIAMGNDPVNGVDKDGGEDTPPDWYAHQNGDGSISTFHWEGHHEQEATAAGQLYVNVAGDDQSADVAMSGAQAFFSRSPEFRGFQRYTDMNSIMTFDQRMAFHQDQRNAWLEANPYFKNHPYDPPLGNDLVGQAFGMYAGGKTLGLIGKGLGAAFTAAKTGTTVIGETMDRVIDAAAKIPGARILNTMPEFTGTADQITSQMMQYNRKWILNEMRSGRTILDIGLDASRTKRSIFYEMEQNMLQNYQKLHPGSLNILKP